MDTVEANGVRLAYDDTGQGAPVVCVHGSWTDRRAWDAVAPTLAQRYRVISYDRRGHSQSERPSEPSGFAAQVEDLAALIAALDAAPAHLLTNSYGGVIALGLAVAHPDRVASLCLHEPPLFSILGESSGVAGLLEEYQVNGERVADEVRAGRHELAARHFVETIALGPGAWELMPEDMRRTMTFNAPTFLDDAGVPAQGVVNIDDLAGVTAPMLLTMGEQSPSPFSMVVDRIVEVTPGCGRSLFPGAGHIPHRTHPEELADVALSFLDGLTSRTTVSTSGAATRVAEAFDRRGHERR